MGYNTVQQIRDLCGMSATVPTDAVIEQWQKLIGSMITQYKSGVGNGIAAVIEGNRISYIYWNMVHNNPKNLQAQQTFPIDPLSQGEKDMIDGVDSSTVWWE